MKVFFTNVLLINVRINLSEDYAAFIFYILFQTPVIGLGPLENYIDVEEGVAFHDCKMYWSCKTFMKMYSIKAESKKTDKCKFKVSTPDTQSPIVTLIASNNKFLSVNDKGHISVNKTEMDETCKFTVSTDMENKTVILKSSNHYLAFNKEHHLCAVKTFADSCKFFTTIGDDISPNFEIIEIKTQKKSFMWKQLLVTEDHYVNKTTEPQTHTFSLNWQTKTTETTSWKHSWGLNSKINFNFLIQGLEFTASYNGEKGKTNTKEKTISHNYSPSVTVKPNTKVIAELYISIEDDVEIPITAVIKKTLRNGNTCILNEHGIWTGMLTEKVQFEIKEENIST